ncbi:oxidoreductase [Paenilisteria rocourtiae]|uniref:Putative dehydrogenase n=1 Tax=Listeria rocourtiae TaxID=647910 RepID=A0A4R6ZHE8_9LIST|nr:oxidoreductase [Listeria rocourtiae]EUJ48144.1 oxidoreductase [Listeria rocourtiae FSL F6-920]TDR51384.1 putative dehydrogenase [Listeria rocourtiae]
MTLTIGYIGFGKSTTRYHMPYTLIRDNIRIKTIYNHRRKPELEADYAQHNIEFTDNLDTLLQDTEIQLVSICTPASTHYDLAKKALENGKNVLVEKPFCTTSEEAEELFALAKSKGLIAMAYQNRRFDSDFLVIKEVLASGKLGELVELESHMDYYRPEAPDAPGEYYDGAFYGLGVHMMDQIIDLFGRPEEVSYDIRSIRNSNNPDDTFEIQFFYPTLKVIVKTSHLVNIPYPKFTLHGTKGSFVKYGIDQQETYLKAGIMPGEKNFGVDPESSYGALVYVDASGKTQQETIPTPLGDYGRLYDQLQDAILNGTPKLVSDEETLTNMTILEQGFTGQNPRVISL